MDPRLKGVGLKSYWGINNSPKATNNLVTYRDNEVIYAVGSRLVMLDYIECKSKLIPLYYTDIHTISSFTISQDSKFLAAAVKFLVTTPALTVAPPVSERKLSLICIDLESLMAIPLKPTLFEHVTEGSEADDIYFSSIAFSSCASLIAMAASSPDLGIFIVDRALGTLLHRVATSHIVLQISFNPMDKNRLCTTGKFNHFQFWRATDKMLHSIPVSNLIKGNQLYTCHCWMGENRIIAGTDSGCLVMLSGGEMQPSKKVFAFGGTDRPGGVNASVVALLTRNDIVVAISAQQYIAIFEMRQGPSPSGGQSVDYSLIKLARIRLPVTSIVGVQWVIYTATSNYEVVVATANALVCLDIKAGDYKMAAVEGHASAAAPVSRTQQSHRGRGSILEQEAIEWVDMKIEKTILTFHSGNVHSLSLATRNSAFVTASDDETIRVWDFSRANKPGLLIDNFSDRKNVIPNSVCMHPSGMSVAFGCEDDVREFNISDSKFEIVRRLPTKVPFTGPAGNPLVNSHPVSLVRYSHGGHLLAAVTGRMAQLFHMYTLDFMSGEPAGLPSRVMAITDHKATINDLMFSIDDAQLYTCSQDGCIYSWDCYGTSRTGEHVEKGIPVVKLAISMNIIPGSMRYIVGSFVSDYYRQNTALGRKIYMNAKDLKKKGTMSGTGLMRTPSERFSRQISQDVGGGGGLGGGGGGTGLGLGLSPFGSSSFHAGRQASESLVGRSESSMGHSVSGDDEGGSKPSIRRHFLCVWKDKLSLNRDLINLESPATAIAFGRLDGHWADRKDILVIGLQDGRVLVSLTPIPFKIVTVHAGPAVGPKVSSRGVSPTKAFMMQSQPISELFALPDAVAESPATAPAAGPPATASTGAAGVGAVSGAPGVSAEAAIVQDTDNKILDMSLCTKLQLHSAEVSEVYVSTSGYWIFTSGLDNSLFMLSSSHRAREFIDIPESNALENTLLITEKAQLMSLRARMEEVDSAIEETKRDCDRTIHKLTDQKNHTISELEAQMKREVRKRDDIILRGREDQARQVRRLNEEMQNIQKRLSEDIVELEYVYEKKLSQEALYLEKMRQAFDEVVVHSRLDITEAQKQVALYDAKLVEQRNSIAADAERQKGVVLAYVDYVRSRYTEVIASLEEGQEEERTRLKSELHGSKAAVDDMRKQTKEEIVTLNRHINDLSKTITTTEEDGFKLKSDLEWANTRIHKLEAALQQATTEVKRNQDSAERWEFKVGEYQEQVRDLEKVRRALTSQLHLLRQELGPKDEKLLESSERLQEVEREYERAIFAISEKEQSLSRKGESLHLLQKQLGELRNSCNQKDATLRRVSKIFEDYKYTIQQNSMKKSLHVAALPSSMRKHAEIGDIGRGGMGGGMGGGEGHSLRDGSISVINESMSHILHAQKAVDSGDTSGASRKYKHLPTEKVEIIVRNEFVESGLKRLTDVLRPYHVLNDGDEVLKDDTEADFDERERQVQLLHDSIEGLRTNLEFTHIVSSAKVKNHITDNMHLLREVNDLRHEVRHISLENQQLKASKRFVDRMRSERLEHANTSTAAVTGAVEIGSPAKPRVSVSQSAVQLSTLVTGGPGAGAGTGPGTRSRPSSSSKATMMTGFQRLNSNSTPHLPPSVTPLSVEAVDKAPGRSPQYYPNPMSFNDDIVDTPKGHHDMDSSPQAAAAARQSMIDSKIADIFDANEDLIRSSRLSAQEILSGYQNLAVGKGSSGGAATDSQTGQGRRKDVGKKKRVAERLPQAVISLPEVSMQARRR